MVRALRNNITSLRNYFSGDTNETNVTKNLIKLLQSEFTISLFKVYAITFFFNHSKPMIRIQTFDWLLNMLSYGPYDMAYIIWSIQYGPYCIYDCNSIYLIKYC